MGYFTQQLIGLFSGRTFRAAGVVLVLLAVGPAFADPEDWLDTPQGPAVDSSTNSFMAQPSVSAAQAAIYARRLHGGRVLSVSPSRRGDALGYRVRVLVPGGRVKTVYVDSGQANQAAPSNPAVRNIGDQ